ncbi:phytanoyl-CoA dioxygenase family protein [bacterium]|jgi:phytanoyl-CoA hydroxylase|nr:phytanoyl-CoA dioxygenase family protein [bacterium]
MDTPQISLDSEKLAHDFNAAGYISIPDFFNSDEVAQLNENRERFIRDVVPTMSKKEVYYDDKSDGSTLKQLQNMDSLDAYFGKLMAPDSKLTALAEACLGEKVVPKNLQYFNKSPKVSTPTPPHQDGYYFHLSPNHAITLWIALEDVAPEQGCLNYVEGSHQFGTRAHGDSETLGFSQSILDFGIPNDLKNARKIPCKAGHLIAHHSRTIHWADGNVSGNKTRQALGAVFFAESCREDTRAKAAYQAHLDAKLAAAGKI